MAKLPMSNSTLLRAPKRHAQEGRGVKSSAERAGVFLYSLAAHIRALCGRGLARSLSAIPIVLCLAVLAGALKMEAQEKKETAPASPTEKIKKAKDAMGKVGEIWKKRPPKVPHDLPHVERPPITTPHVSSRDHVFPDHGMVIHHRLNGQRQVLVESPDHSRIFAERGGRDFVEHPFRYRDGEFAHRTYYYNGRFYSRYYGRYYYHRATIYYYAPSHYYPTAFYTWAYYPWPRPVPYVWGFGGSPWYGYYGYYFAPAPMYPSLSLWLTDYLISTSLATYYQERVQSAELAQSAAAPPPGSSPITPEVRDLISAEVQRQIALENVEVANTETGVPNPAYSSIQQLLADPTPPALVVGNELDVVSSAGGECALSPGDALQLATTPPPDSTVPTMLVLASKGDPECRKGTVVSVQIADLQEMQNHMRATIDAGLAELHNPQGSGSTLPPVPVPAPLNEPPVNAGFLAAAPPPDPNVAAEIDQQIKAADQAEGQGVVAPIPAPAQPTTPRPSLIVISIGESVADVITALGKPDRIEHVSPKEIYFYRDRKITFEDGKVSSIAALDEEPAAAGSGDKSPQASVIEPDGVGDFYSQDEAGTFVPLERTVGNRKDLGHHTLRSKAKIPNPAEEWMENSVCRPALRGS